MIRQPIKQRTWMVWGVIAIEVVTILNGATQALASQAVLSALGANTH